MQLSFYVLLFVSAVFAVKDEPYKVGYYEQILDHFNFEQSTTFKQRYLYSGRFLFKLFIVNSTNCNNLQNIFFL